MNFRDYKFSKDPRTHSLARCSMSRRWLTHHEPTPAKTTVHLQMSPSGNKRHLPIQKHIFTQRIWGRQISLLSIKARQVTIIQRGTESRSWVTLLRHALASRSWHFTAAVAPWWGHLRTGGEREDQSTSNYSVTRRQGSGEERQESPVFCSCSRPAVIMAWWTLCFLQENKKYPNTQGSYRWGENSLGEVSATFNPGSKFPGSEIAAVIFLTVKFAEKRRAARSLSKPNDDGTSMTSHQNFNNALSLCKRGARWFKLDQKVVYF